MQDFTKVKKTDQKLSDVPTIAEEAVPTENISFKNKDNFWNLMFVLGMIVGSMTIGMMFAIIIMAFVLNRFNGVTVKENKIFNSQGREIDVRTQLPKLGIVLVWSGLALWATGGVFDAHFKHISNTISFPIMFLVFFSVFTLCFILKNCPISVLFNSKVWAIPNIDPGNTYHHKRDHSTSSSAYFTDARFSHLPNNVYNRDRLK